MLQKNSAWEGKAKIIAISLDDATQAVKDRIAEKNWNKVGSVWGGENGFGSSASQSFQVQGIPTCALVHKSKILWVGHPSERNLESDINSLIAGEEFKSKAPEADAATGEANPSLTKE
jgi:hypothetical protein